MIIRVPESAGQHYERIQYPAGELQVRLLPGAIRELYDADENTEGKIAVICRNAHQHLMELALLSDALHTLAPFIESTLVLPYLPYGRADRRFVEGDCHGLNTFGRIINQMCYNQIKTLDAHSFRAKRGVANLTDVSARPFISKAIADICDHGGHPVVLLPDEGAQRYGLAGALQCHKKRDSVTGKLSGFEVPAISSGHSALIVDDICDGGGTFVGLAKEICKIYDADGLNAWDEPKPKLYLYVTHGIFSKGVEPLLEHFEKIYTTNSIFYEQTGYEVAPPEIKVFDYEPVLLENT